MDKKTRFKHALQTSKGYSFMELMMVLSIIAIVSQIGFTAWLDSKRKAYDASAVADTRNLIEAIVNDMVGGEDVCYTQDPEDGDRIGAFTKAEEDNMYDRGDPRKPSLFLSPGVKARIDGATDVLDTNTGVTNTYVEAYLYHEGGKPWSTSTSGFREFIAIIDEAREEITFVGFKIR